MMRDGKTKIVLGAAACVLFAAGIWHLFHMRFESGDIYPPYSSLRTDPLGTKVFYQSLQESGIAVSRSFVPPEKLDAAHESTMFFLGHEFRIGDWSMMLDRHEISALRDFVRKGGRVVVTFLPQPSRTFRPSPEDAGETPRAESGRGIDSAKAGNQPGRTNTASQVPGKKPKDEKAPVKADAKPVKATPRKPTGAKSKEARELEEAGTKWLQVGIASADPSGEDRAVLSTNAAAPGLPGHISCHTAAYFSGVDQTRWTVVYRQANQPVIIERKYGKGSLVLSTPTYFVSNEAMRNERQTGLLLWLMDGRKRAVFDEFSHGMTLNPNTATLLRNYRLHWFIASLLLLALLFVWKNSMSLVPAHAEDDEMPDRRLQGGKDSLSGLVNLLRRNVDRATLLGVCVARWKQNLGATGRNINKKKIELVDAAVLTSRASSPVDAYNEICGIIHKESPN